MGNRRKSLFAEIGNGFRMGGKIPSLCQLQIEHGNVQPALRADSGVFLAQGACRRVAGIGHQGFSLQLQLLVDLLKYTARHIHLAAHDQARQFFRQRFGNRTDRPQILRYILPHLSVTAGRSLIKHTVAVFQRHGQAVNLRLHAVCRLRQRFSYLLQKRPYLIAVKHILQALQRYRMYYLGKIVQSLITHALCG